MSWLIQRGCLYIMYCNYTVNTNPTKDISVAKTQLITTVETICRRYNTFNFGVFKLKMRICSGRYAYYYPSYLSTYFSPLTTILADEDNKDKELFLTKFKEWVNQCDDLFVLYLYLNIFEYSDKI